MNSIFQSLVFLVIVLFIYREFLKFVYILKARDEWILLLIEREHDPKHFTEHYKNNPLKHTEYYHLWLYYKQNDDEGIISDASKWSFPDFKFKLKLLETIH